MSDRLDQRKDAIKRMAAEDIEKGIVRTGPNYSRADHEARIGRAFERQDRIDRTEGGR